ncbi:ATP-binding protein [Thermoflavimicrobium dichotomicum]|uniref:Serine/threonine-protein kinase RsbT n=1 Tax=Thermoflavimicrobium dichotomicum TaxID=46223 RepID=A0A1I3JDX8_9BACL|nr:ATP-binding protein [Thermoflavimicrobium dichotomicum]SFI58471.1 serine/threonine-protein kinase RsbT [Thermoflavimicrobium dichotomicum]
MDKTTFHIKDEENIVHARSEVREIARSLGFDELDQARIVQSVSELARNVIQYAKEGTITVEVLTVEDRKGLKIKVEDFGPGIPNVKELMMEAKRKHNGETSGLQQVRMLMDDMNIKTSETGEAGTCVEVIKWLKTSTMLNGKS